MLPVPWAAAITGNQLTSSVRRAPTHSSVSIGHMAPVPLKLPPPPPPPSPDVEPSPDTAAGPSPDVAVKPSPIVSVEPSGPPVPGPAELLLHAAAAPMSANARPHDA